MPILTPASAMRRLVAGVTGTVKSGKSKRANPLGEELTCGLPFGPFLKQTHADPANPLHVLTVQAKEACFTLTSGHRTEWLGHFVNFESPVHTELASCLGRCGNCTRNEFLQIDPADHLMALELGYR
jgi:hypothetical protein